MNGSLAITGSGMNSSLGRSVQAAAAFRAGLSRAAELPLVVQDSNGREGVPAIGHAVQGAAGFEGLGKLVQLALPALADLKDSSPELEPRVRTALLLNVASTFLGDCYDELDVESGFAPDAVEQSQHTADLQQSLGAALSGTVQTLAGISEVVHHEVHFEGGAGGLGLLAVAARLLEEGRADRCLVGGIDSCIVPDQLETLLGLGLLKTPDQPHGLIPGEAAAFVWVEPVARARRRGVGIQTLVGPLATAEEPPHRFSREAPQGEALSSAIRDVEARLPRNGGRIGAVISDLNGDPWRAREWGHALARLGSKSALASCPVWVPAVSFGELGSASSIVGVCLATRALVRGYSPTSTILVSSSSYDGRKAAAAVSSHGILQ